MFRIGAVSLGTPYHANIFVNNMNQQLKHYKFTFIEPSKKYGFSHINPMELDVLWFYGFYTNSDMLISLFKDENPELKVIVTWVGTDLLQFAQFVRVRPQCKDCLVKNVDVHLADGRNLKLELATLGIQARYIPSIPDSPLKLEPLPEKFAVAAYVPPFRADFFNYGMIREVAQRLRDVPFHLFGMPTKDKPSLPNMPPNMSFHGFVVGEEKNKWWKNTSVLLYLPIHGSLSVTAIEFLQMERYAICTRDYPHIFKGSSADEIVKVLKKLKRRKKGNIKGSKYYLAEYSVERQSSLVRNVLDNL